MNGFIWLAAGLALVVAAAALVVWAMVSIPLLLAFTVAATLALLSVTWSLYRLARKKVPPCSK